MSSLWEVYNSSRWTRAFGAWGREYTIALAPFGGGYHIGQDIAMANGEAIPALVGGTVINVVNTDSMGRIVVIRGDDGNYYTYCHLANDGLPGAGRRIAQGERVGRAANGPRGIPPYSAEFPGTAWLGRHLHLVIGTHPLSAYNKIPGHRTLSAFFDPRDTIRSILSRPAGGDSTPFDPQEDFLSYLSETQQRQMYEALVKGGPSASAYYTPDAIINILRDEIAKQIAAIAAGGIMFPGAGYAAFPAVVNAIREGNNKPAVDVDEEALAKNLAPAIAPLIAQNVGTLSDETLRQIGQAVNNEADAREIKRRTEN